jgi:hypothetical protein
MRAFVTEGRLAAHSLVARAGQEVFRPASDDDQLCTFFASVRQQTPSASGKFLTANRADDEDPASIGHGRGTEDARVSERGRYLILADMKSSSISGMEDEIQNLGTSYEILPQAWLLVTDQGINAVRNALIQKLGKIDVLFIVDATRNKAAWFNFGIEAEARIRRLWTSQNEVSGAKSATG